MIGTITTDWRRVGAWELDDRRAPPARPVAGDDTRARAARARSPVRLRQRTVRHGTDLAAAVLVVVERTDDLVPRPTTGCTSRGSLKTSRSLSPTRSTIAWKSSTAAMPCWMLLITASSALRCSVSFSSRCVSSNRRAFSSATPMLAATSAAAGPPLRRTHSRARSFRVRSASARSPLIIGTNRSICCDRCPVSWSACRVALPPAVVDDQRLAPAHGLRDGTPAIPRRRPSAMCSACRARTRTGSWTRFAVVVVPRIPMSPDRKTSRSLSPTRSMMAWKSRLAGHPLLHAVDDGEFVGALLEQRVARLQFPGALRDLLLQPLRPLRVVERDSGLARQHAQQVAVGVVEASERAVDVERTGSPATASARSAARRCASAGRADWRGPA